MARKKRLKIALIGYGAISQTLFDLFREKKPIIAAHLMLSAQRAIGASQRDAGAAHGISLPQFFPDFG